MSAGPPVPEPASPPDPVPALPDRNKLGLTGLIALGIAYMGLALAAYFCFGIMEGLAGPVVPLAFLAVTAAMLPTAASYAVMNARRPSAGSAFTWLWEATVPWLGVWLGWILVITYIVGAALQPVMFGLFFNSFLNVVGVHAGTLTALCGSAVAVLATAFLTRRDIRISVRAIGIFICIEASFVALLSVYIVITQGLRGRLSWQPLIPGHATSWPGFVNAVLFAVLSIAAFDVVAPVAEETKVPRSVVPKATIIVTVAAGAYWAVTSFGIVSGVPAATMASYVSSGQFTPIYLVAEHYLGAAKIMVPLTGFTASLAALSAVSIAASRQLFALARRHMAPRAFAATGPCDAVPWSTHLLVLACCAVLPVVITLYQNASPLLAFAWIGQTYVFLILIPYTLTCCANIIYHFRYHAAQVRWLTNLALPAAGIVINCYIFYRNFLVTFVFHPTSFKFQTSITVACFTLVACAAIATAVGSGRHRRQGAPDGTAGQDPGPRR
ncbi:MAG TPA: APC family permease [Trebonia sp.]|nr:APC family permease [Trebonia sp.]